MTAECYDVAIIGGGHAGSRAAEGARQANAEISIAVLGGEPHLPYERPPLSKRALKEPQRLASHFRHDAAYYDAQRITLKLGVQVIGVDTRSNSVKLADGTCVAYRNIVLATGSTPRPLPLLNGLPNVFYLRTIDDARGLSQHLQPGASIGVVGAGFIGLEVAATAKAVGCSVVVFEQAEDVLGRVLPAYIAGIIQNHHTSREIDIRTSCRVLSATTSPSGRPVLHTDHGGDCEFDAIVVGIGVQPNLELAQHMGLAIGDGILVDDYGRTSMAGVYAAGEVTCHPVPFSNAHVRHEFWQVAEHQALCTGLSVAGKSTAFREIPWFWSDQGDLNLQVVGAWTGEVQWALRSTRNDQVVALAVAHGVLVGAVCINSGRDVSIVKRLIVRQVRLIPAELEDLDIPLSRFLQ